MAEGGDSAISVRRLLFLILTPAPLAISCSATSLWREVVIICGGVSPERHDCLAVGDRK
jgi:hypothetical protein